MRFALRLALPDRPGALSGVAAALGERGADIVALEVVERTSGVAVDDVSVEAACGPRDLRKALEAVPGVTVEAIRGVVRFRDATAPVDLAAALATGGPERLAVLVAGLPQALWATWCVALRHGRRGCEVLAAAGGVPDVCGVLAPWLPLEGPRVVELGPWLPPDVEEGARRAAVALAAAPVGGADTAVLLARVGGPCFRDAELRQLGQLAAIATAGGAVDLIAPAGPAATAGMS